jgi:hypothetical protein
MNLEQITGNKQLETLRHEDSDRWLPKEIKESSELGDGATEVLEPDIPFIENTSRLALFEQNRSKGGESFAQAETSIEAAENRPEGLTDEEKLIVKKETGWSEEIINAIGSMKEYEIYKKAGLQEAEINGKKCLIRTDIDMEQTDVKGRTNKERMEQGLAPLDKNGKPIELHHIGQHADSPLAELTFEEHHCGGNDSILHDKNKESEVHGEGNKWQQEKESHWESRSKKM